MNTIQSYPWQSHAKILVKIHEKSFDVRKTTNAGIGYDRQLAICEHTSCPMVLEKCLQVWSRICNPIEKSFLLEFATPNLKCKSSLKVDHFLEMLNPFYCPKY